MANQSAIEKELVVVEAKVTRSTNLLESLSHEQGRWEETSESFKTQVSLYFVLGQANILYFDIIIQQKIHDRLLF